MIHLHARRSDGTILHDTPLQQLATIIAEPGCVCWLDVESPVPEELQTLADALGWSELTVEDLEQQGQRAKIESYEGYTVLVMHDIEFGGSPQRVSTPEVDFVIGSNYVASVHYHPLENIGAMHALDERSADVLARGADFLLYSLIDCLVDGYFPVMDDMNEAVEDLEQAIIQEPSAVLLARIFEMKRDSVVLRRIISPQLEVFALLMSPNFGIMREEHGIYFRDVHDHIFRVYEATDTYRDLMSDALAAYLSNVNNRLSEVMKRLTVISSVLLPLTLFSGLMGMNLTATPPWSAFEFWAIGAGMVGFSVLLLAYFKRQGWF